MTANEETYLRLHVGIIGGGASGLVTCKELLEEGHTCMIFEKYDSIGGLFSHSGYEDGMMVSSNLITMFSDYVGNDEDILEKPRMFSFLEYAQYLNDYAKHFNLLPYIQYQTFVQSIWKDIELNKWKMYVKDDKNEYTIYIFDRIAICCGTHQSTNKPIFKNQEKFQGKIKHSHDIKIFDKEFSNKRVCIVGSGESGSDMILAASKYSKKCYLSIRHDHGFIIPRYIYGKYGPGDLDTTRVHHSIPRAWGIFHTYIDMWNSLLKLYIKYLFINKCKFSQDDIIRQMGIQMNLQQIKTSNLWNTFGTKNSNLVKALINYDSKCQRKPGIYELTSNSIIFNDNSIEEIDEIICCSGYKSSFDFLKQSNNDKLIRIANEACISHNLYKHCFHPDIENGELIWIGFTRPCFGAIPPLAELQARWFALLCSNKLKLPNREIQLNQIEKYVKYLKWQLTSYRTERITSLTDFLLYSDDISRIINCRPNFIKIFFTDLKLWLKLMCGPLMNAHYRLTGPHSKRKQARNIILKAKWIKQSNLLYLTMLLIYSFFWFVFGIESCKPNGWYQL
ncbi:unnamed protein product [Didymodactylos carnosus]|uniref:Flavin-containing monooxygenase n=1 Tax=Didymodactylos carnosus TaxID=1234261 RepID=A0A814LY79_9BILA|nr:unnamed protein product [Didymodactylos carnosus]CAF1072415.1 unnamed protein product [Didymodactylos carnosus]CAF3714967.1 unnamed protein product [Didymodactylos carnosus]CAF3839524.1 unnamed protein product [Didymodactylos carnosus]